MFKNIRSFISRSINHKIIVITALCLLVFLSAVLSVIYFGMKDLKDETLDVAGDQMNTIITEYYHNYIDAIDLRIESEIKQVFEELHILSSIIQTFFDHRSEMDSVVDSLKTSPYFMDYLRQNEKYYQNIDSEPTAVFVASYMIDDNGIIDKAAMKLIDDTQILDLVLPAFYEHGVKKIQVYFQGGQNKEIFRIAPWTNIGEDIVAVYPEIFDLPIWDTFNPGLAEQWTSWINGMADESELDEMLRVTSPVQDGLTGDLTLTFSQPIADETKTTFEGTISYDVPIANIVALVENIEIAESGFAFIQQKSNNNLFAINEEGLKTLGLKADMDSTIDEGEGFNRLSRTLNDSIYEDVHSMNLNASEIPKIEIVEVNGKKFFLTSKSLLSYQSWSPEAGFFDEGWEIAFLAPYDEIYATYNIFDDNITEKMGEINLRAIGITILIALVILYLIYRFNKMLTSELVTLSHAAGQAKEKKYNVTVAVKSKDEVGVLGLALNDMLSEIRSSFNKLESQNEALKEEIKQRKQKDRIIDYLENFDAGTDLPNKKALLNILQDIKPEPQGFISLVVIGLDEFRKVNEAYSWTFGDKLMSVISHQLKELLPEDTILFKLSGDEFAFLLKETKFKQLLSIIEQVSELFKSPFMVEKESIAIGSSLGISSYPYDSSDPMDIFKYAANAMTHAKEVNRGKYEFYNEEINNTARMRMEMMNEMRGAVDADEFELLYQPIVATDTLEVTGMEALIRWHNKSLGNVPPSVFIPLAEQTKQILTIGQWVINRALTDTKALHDMGYDHLNIAINVSVIQFLEDGFVKSLKDSIERIGIDPHKVTIEITEGLFINDLDKILYVLNTIRQLGILISVDDFGTGYSSLAYIKNLPLSKLKIDRAFINEIHEEKSYKLVAGIIGLAQNLNLSVVAEGIETELQLEVVREKMCQEAQGYMFSKPLKLDDFKKYIK